MKKYTSAAALALRLSMTNVLAVLIPVGIFQGVQFYLAMRDVDPSSFEAIWNGPPGTLGLFGFAALVIALYSATADGRKNRTAYTLRRLQLSEGALTAVWAAVFAGWFLVYWAYQTGVVLLSFRFWAKATEMGANYRFVTAYRLPYFHFLLPLSEPWALARNLVLFLAGGIYAALSGANQRRGRGFPLCMFLVNLVFCMILWPGEMASKTNDVSLIVLTLICLGIDLFWSRNWRCVSDEAN